jgi:tRNA A37 threonylcarbamoyladenosine dehydratase
MSELSSNKKIKQSPSLKARALRLLSQREYSRKGLAAKLAELVVLHAKESELTVNEVFIKDDITKNLLESAHWDYVVDCIDTLSAKVFLIKGCLDRKIPIVSSMGAGGKVDPSQIQVIDISKTKICNLARYVRKRLQNLGIKKGLKVVFSPEKADQDKIIVTEKAYPKKSIIGTLSYMPAMFGCTAASVVIRDLMATD